jgi:hypothetical protein
VSKMPTGERATVHVFALAALLAAHQVAAASGKQSAAKAACEATASELFHEPARTPGGKVTHPKWLSGPPKNMPQCTVDRVPVGSWFAYELIGPDGLIHGVWVLREPRFSPPCPAWSRGALAYVKNAKFSPATLDGRPVPVCLTVTAHYALSSK